MVAPARARGIDDAIERLRRPCRRMLQVVACRVSPSRDGAQSCRVAMKAGKQPDVAPRLGTSRRWGGLRRMSSGGFGYTI